MTRKKSKDGSDPAEDTAALAAEAARLEAKKALDDDSGAVESAALSEVALTDADVDVVAETPTSPITDTVTSADVVAETPPPAPQPEWMAKAKMLSSKTGEPNGAWHDYFKEPVPTTPPVATWTGKDATYNQYEGGRILAKYHQGGFYAVLTTPLPPVERRPLRK